MVAGLVVLTLGLTSLYLVADQLPLSVQRSLSVLPGIEIDPLARDNALDTLNDRVEVLTFDTERMAAAADDPAAAATDLTRMGQELHDVVAHSLGVIAVQAGVGSHVIDTDPEEARRALGIA